MWHWDRFSPGPWVSPASHSTLIIHHPGLVQWTSGLGLTAPQDSSYCEGVSIQFSLQAMLHKLLDEFF
jgi:hypothetical protein